jgi:hypothetical protein
VLDLAQLARDRLTPTPQLLQAEDVVLVRIHSALALALQPLLQVLLLRSEARGLVVLGLPPL